MYFGGKLIEGDCVGCELVQMYQFFCFTFPPNPSANCNIKCDILLQLYFGVAISNNDISSNVVSTDFPVAIACHFTNNRQLFILF